jgi:aspartyl/asparaginyl beta-hydroxylase (cupin superfamily)
MLSLARKTGWNIMLFARPSFVLSYNELTNQASTLPSKHGVAINTLFIWTNDLD